MMSLTFLLLTVLQGAQDQPSADQSSVDRLISDLAAPDVQRREKAETELRKLGKKAVPALREAARSENAEKAMRARALLLELAGDQHRKDEQKEPSQGRSPAPRMTV